MGAGRRRTAPPPAAVRAGGGVRPRARARRRQHGARARRQRARLLTAVDRDVVLRRRRHRRPAAHPLGANERRRGMTVDDLLAAARARLDRVDPQRAAELAEGGALLGDTPPQWQRDQEGAPPGALLISAERAQSTIIRAAKGCVRATIRLAAQTWRLVSAGARPGPSGSASPTPGTASASGVRTAPPAAPRSSSRSPATPVPARPRRAGHPARRRTRRRPREPAPSTPRPV